ncbi:MAG: hypothetical protein WDM81_06480 [Rhizomicrobium sp.]
MDGVQIEETEPWREGSQTWRVLRAWFPDSIETHSQVQDFFFDESLMLRRHDYNVNIAGGFGASQLTSDYVAVDGISPAHEAPGLHARARPASGSGNADGVHRHQRRELRLNAGY